VKLRTLSPVTRSGLILLALGCVTLLAIVGLERSETSAVALSLFQSPPVSPITTPVAASAAQPPPPVAAGPPTSMWLVIGVVVVVVLLLIGLFLLRRR